MVADDQGHAGVTGRIGGHVWYSTCGSDGRDIMLVDGPGEHAAETAA